MDIYKCPISRKSKENPNRVFYNFYKIPVFCVILSITLLIVLETRRI